jgi:hypothetical protein
VALPVDSDPVLDAVGRRGALVYEFQRAGPRTVLTHSSCSSPWHYFPPSYLDDSGCAYTWLVNPSGGLVGGDHLSVKAELSRGRHVLMTRPSANRIYRSLTNQLFRTFMWTSDQPPGWSGCLNWRCRMPDPFPAIHSCRFVTGGHHGVGGCDGVGPDGQGRGWRCNVITWPPCLFWGGVFR